MSIYHKIISRILTLNKTNKDLAWMDRKVTEILWSQKFGHSIVDADWLKKKAVSASGAAANYSFLYVLFQILNHFKPKLILEIGLGQTTKLNSQYVAYHNPHAQLYVVEDCLDWIKMFDEFLNLSSNIKLLHLPLEKINVNGFSVDSYKNLNHLVETVKFNLIINDGPMGNDRYSRSGIIDLIPQNLAQSFVILFDDYDRRGEQDTVALVCNKLKEHSYQFKTTIYKGIKHQYLIYSPDMYMLREL